MVNVRFQLDSVIESVQPSMNIVKVAEVPVGDGMPVTVKTSATADESIVEIWPDNDDGKVTKSTVTSRKRGAGLDARCANP